jgi:hypothetical protein
VRCSWPTSSPEGGGAHLARRAAPRAPSRARLAMGEQVMVGAPCSKKLAPQGEDGWRRGEAG